MSYKDIPGWGDDIPIFYEKTAKEIPKNGRFLEIGSFLGRGLACMAELRPDVEIWAIDPLLGGPSEGYTGEHGYTDQIQKAGGLFRAFIATLRAHSPNTLERVKLLRCRSDEVKPAGLDMIFIDGAHDYLSVLMDIRRARDWTNPGGIISGHDYRDGFPGVVQAVKEATAGIEVMGTCWRAKAWNPASS